jgi:hypothetical protein
MSCQRSPRPLSVLTSALAAVGVLAMAGCSTVTPLGPDPAPASLPPARDLGSPIIMQIMRSQPPAPSGRCRAGAMSLFGSQPDVARARVVQALPAQTQLAQASTPTPTRAATPATPPAPSSGVACYRPVGTAVTITSAAVSSVSPGWPG